MTSPDKPSRATAPGARFRYPARLVAVLLAIVAASITTPAQAVVVLYDWGFNIDGTPHDSFPATNSAPGQGGAATLPPSIDDSMFDFSTNGADPGGLGTIRVTLGGTGAHTVGVLFDHEIDEPTNTFFNETGAAMGVPAAGQSWEIDKPRTSTSPFSASPPHNYIGDIIDNFFLPPDPPNLPQLDNQAFFDAIDNQSLADATMGAPGGPADLAMAMAWDFVLADGERAIIDFIVSDMQPNMGFYLQQTDPDTDLSIYFYSTLSIRDVAIPAPASLLLLGLGLVGFAAARRSRS